ncbi:MAG: DUF4365 domain-containing protein [Actinobacteria bacterium]|nr:DUF4365 domain-containing protein [Actinomycetota bacterium]
MSSTESGRAFLAAIPSSWTVEQRESDYGVDFDVELFQGGHTTGLHFGVQLKSTDKARRRASVRIKRSTANYWSSLEYPILVVLYESVSGRLWWQWWHRYDPHGSDTSAARFTLPFPSDQVWDKTETPADIETEVAAYRSWASAEAHLPLRVVIRGEGEVAGVGVGSIIAALRRRLRNFEDLFQVGASPAGPLSLTVDIAPNESVVWISGGGSATLHYPGVEATHLDGDVAKRLSADLLLLIADRVAVLGLKKHAARVVSDAMRESSVVFDPDIASKALFLLLEGGPVAEAIDLLHALTRQPSEEVAIIGMQMALSWATMASKDARRRVIDALVMWPTDPDEPDRDLHAGQFTFNAAQLARQDDLNDSLSLMLRAAELDPQYLDRGYWWREKGGLLFLLGRHREAVAAYQEAVARGESGARAFLADALLWSREFDEAVELFNEVAKEGSSSRAEWRLKANVFRDLREYQQSEPRLNDLLDASLLNQLAVESATPEHARTALAIGAALVAESTPELWLQAMGASLQAGEHFEDVVLTARRFCGDDMVDCILEQSADGDAAQGLLELFDQLPLETEPPNVIRLIEPKSGEVRVIDLNQPSAIEDGAEGDRTAS